MNAQQFIKANRLNLHSFEIDQRSDGVRWGGDPAARHFLCVLTRELRDGGGLAVGGNSSMVISGMHRAMTFEYSQGSRINGSPTLASVLETLSGDAGGADLTFSEWCQDFDYSDDSIAHRSVYEACVRTRAELVRVLGAEAFEQLQGVEW